MKQNSSLRWFLVLVIIVGLGGWAITGLLIYARLSYIGLLLLVGAGIWSITSMRGIQLVRQARTLRASMGDVFEEHFEIRKKTWPGCLWLEVVNQSTLPMAGGSRLLTGIGAKQRRFYTARTILYRRGAFLLGPTSLASGDPFGLFTIRRTLPSKDTLVVLPMAVLIKDFPPPPGLLPGGKAVRQRTVDVTPHAAGVREYVPGDPMKRIHWRTTAHRGRFMVKEFEQDPQSDIWIFVDARVDARVYTSEQTIQYHEEGWWLRRPKVDLPPDSFEYAISVAASLANYFLQDRRSVGLVSAAGKITVVNAERGERQVTKIMETLAFLQATGSMSMLSLVSLQVKLLPVGTGVIIVTSSVQPELLLAVEDIQRRNLRPVVVMIKPESFGGQEDSLSITSGLISHNVPVCSVGLGDDLSVKLALPVVYFNRPYYQNDFFKN